MVVNRKSPHSQLPCYRAKVRDHLIVGLLMLAGAAGLSASSASAQNCQQLWVERNSYYKESGYCFKTRRAISFFGNAGCAYDDEASVPLPRGIRERIAEITAIERSHGCN